jgi:3-oxoacyl-[acyl-carrier-protein] synthase-3
LHQANERIVKAAAKKLKVDMSRFPINMENYANTSAASIPILLDELVQTGRLRKGQKILLAGFGAGLTWAGSILEW